MAKIVENMQEFNQILNLDKVVVDFYADWCGPCKMMAPFFEKVSEEFPEINFIKVNVDVAREISDKYSIMSIPTTIVFVNGEVYKKHTGFLNKEGLEELIK
ncbi:thioredoxin [Spiroplasma endosymbiont of Crioceris asparagi]|uniref:thioredoxin n=1 Tax=Spiroplasma endosymbiont of Crioceris asparagi TaxID=3066286 RepID=UPI0030CD7B50